MRPLHSAAIATVLGIVTMVIALVDGASVPGAVLTALGTLVPLIAVTLISNERPDSPQDRDGSRPDQ